MAKSLTFWSVILGFILGAFANTTENLPLSAWDYADTRFWRFAILFLVALVSAFVFYLIERKSSIKIEKDNAEFRNIVIGLTESVKDLISEIREDRNERRNSNNRDN